MFGLSKIQRLWHVNSVGSVLFRRKGSPSGIRSRQILMNVAKLSNDTIKRSTEPEQLRPPDNSQVQPQMDHKTSVLHKLLFNVGFVIEEVSHMDEVRKAQNRVFQLKDRLTEWGQRKREILHNLSGIRRELKRVHDDIVVIKRGTDGYLSLIQSEIKLLKEEEQLQTDYEKADETERDLFTQLTAAINDSYEKEKLHASTLRLWVLLASVITSTITLIFTTFTSYRYNRHIGLVGSKFDDADSAFREVHQKLDTVIVNLKQGIGRQESAPTSQESWGAYLSRHGSNVYRYFVPKRQ